MYRAPFQSLRYLQPCFHCISSHFEMDSAIPTICPVNQQGKVLLKMGNTWHVQKIAVCWNWHHHKGVSGSIVGHVSPFIGSCLASLVSRLVSHEWFQ